MGAREGEGVESYEQAEYIGSLDIRVGKISKKVGGSEGR